MQYDDGAKIHRSQIALAAVDLNFKDGIPYDLQAPKIADVWPIENVWAFLMQDFDGKEHRLSENYSSVASNLSEPETMQVAYQLCT